MGKQQSKTALDRERRAADRRRRLLSTGLLSIALLAGLITWYVYPRQPSVSAAAQYRGGPRLAVEQDAIDFGPVRFEKMVHAVFRLRNVGDQPLTIAANPQVEVVEGC